MTRLVKIEGRICPRIESSARYSGLVASRARLLAGIVLALAALHGCAVKPAVMDKGEPIPLHSTDPRYGGYLSRVSGLIKEKWGYPCVKDTATARCDYKAAHLVVEFGLLADGRVACVTVTKSAPWQIYDDYAVNAVHLASPFPPVPPELMAQAKPGREDVRIVAAFQYVLDLRERSK